MFCESIKWNHHCLTCDAFDVFGKQMHPLLFFVAMNPVATFLKRVNQYNLLSEKPNLEELLLWCWNPDKAEGYQSSQYYSKPRESKPADAKKEKQNPLPSQLLDAKIHPLLPRPGSLPGTIHLSHRLKCHLFSALCVTPNKITLRDGNREKNKWENCICFPCNFGH